MGKAREKQAKTRENRRKQAKNRRFFGAIFLGGGNWSVLIFTPFATMAKRGNVDVVAVHVGDVEHCSN